MSARSSSIPLKEEVREELAKLLDETLGCAIAVHLQTKMCHWNVRGPRFYFLHLLFDTVAEKVEGYIDPIAERIGQLGFAVKSGSPKKVGQSALASVIGETCSPESFYIESLRDLLVKMSALVHTQIERADELEDPGTADLLTGFVRELDQMAWFVGSHLEGE